MGRQRRLAARDRHQERAADDVAQALEEVGEDQHPGRHAIGAVAACPRPCRCGRCLETARIAFGGAEGWAPLDNIWDDRTREAAQSAEVRKRIKEWSRPGALALVTHGVNIVALTGVSPVEGEVVVLKPDAAGDFRVVGRIGPND